MTAPAAIAATGADRAAAKRVFDALAEGVAVFDLAGHLVHQNPALTNLQAAEPGDEVPALRLRRHDVLELPAEQPAVEGQGALEVRRGEVDHARAFGHTFGSW